MKIKELFSIKSDFNNLVMTDKNIISDIKDLPVSFFGEYKKIVILVWKKLQEKKKK